MKILFINPLFKSSFLNTRYRKIDNIIPPLGVLYIAALLKRNNIESIFLDGLQSCSNMRGFLNIIKNHKPDVVGITSMTSNFDIARNIAKEIKNIRNDIVTIIGGNHVTGFPDCVRGSDFDVGVIGEGEFTFLELVTSLEEKSDFRHIKGIVYKEGDSIKLNDPRPIIRDPDIFPYPRRELLKNIYEYHPAIFNYKNLPCTTILTSRGCNNKCIFCINSLNNKTYWRRHSLGYVLDEIEEIISRYNIRNFWILDDDFTFNKKRTYSICEGILKKNLKITWSCMSNVKNADYELFEIMKKAGCWQIAFGIESGSQRVLDLINKNIDLEKIRIAINLAARVKIETKGFFLLGLPTETVDDIKKSISFANSVPLDYAVFFPVTVIPGSLLEKEADRYGRSINCSSKLIMPYTQKTFLPNSISETELITWRNKAYYKFYFRPRYILKQIIKLRNFTDLKNKFFAFKTLLFRL